MFTTSVGVVAVVLAVVVSTVCLADGLPPQTDHDRNPYADTYEDKHRFDQAFEYWGPFNVHDPALLNDGEYVYSYSTDVAWGQKIERAGIQVRRSKDLVDWEFRGWALEGLPREALAHIDAHGGKAFEGVWAPYTVKVADGKYRLYYSLSSRVPKNSVIGLLTGPTPEGPWSESGLVVWSRDDVPGTNAIDPTVMITDSGEQWMFYGSAWDGIYALRLNPETGLAMRRDDRGIRVAQRGNTAGTINGNIEAPEIVYNPEFKKYYLFISYDWLHTKYNVRVARSDRPEGPYYDAEGRPVNTHEDHGPMVVAAYRFNGHPGWQGVAHCGVVQRNGRWFLASQGRPANSDYSMVMHVRELYWTPDGWPVVSPERFAGRDNRPIAVSELKGLWEVIDFDYKVVPGFADEQKDPGFLASTPVRLEADGQVIGAAWKHWSYDGGLLVVQDESNGDALTFIVDRAWDWERQCPTIIWTGIGPDHYPIWGKRIEK